MAEMKTLNTRIKLRIDTLENWNNSTVQLLPGEIALATVAATAGTGLTEPVVMMKVASEEEKTFSELPWAFHAKASDVLAACKSEAALKTFVNGVIADAGIASSDAMEALAKRVTTAEGKVTTLEGTVGNAEGGLVKDVAANAAAIEAIEAKFGADTVALEIEAAITALDLANTYEKKGEAAKVQSALDTYKTSNDAAVQKNATDISGEIARAKAAEEANANAITAIKDGTTIDSFADVESALAGKEASGAAEQALKDAKAYADGLAGNYDAKGAAATAESNAKAYAKEYADGLAGNYDAAGSADAALEAAKGYTDGFTGGKTVSESINAVIANYTTTTDMNTAIGNAETAAKSHATQLNTAMNTRVEALEAIDHDHANKGVLDGITAEKVAAWDAAEQNAKDYADGKDETIAAAKKAGEDAQKDVDALEELVGVLPEGATATDIVGYINEKTNGIATDAALGELQDAVDVIEADYLKAADKKALQDQIDVIDGLVGDETVAKQITDVTDPLAARVKAVEDDYLKAADKTELQGNIDTVSAAVERLTNGVSAEEVDGVNDLIQYVKDHGTEVTGIKGDIKANADAIDAIEKDYLKAADKTELANAVAAEKTRAEGIEGGLETRLQAVEAAVGESGSVADDIAGALAEAKKYTDDEVKELAEGAVATNAADIDKLEAKVGDKTVSEQISAVTNPLAERVVALEAVDHSHANAAELDKFAEGDKAKLDSAVQSVTAGTGLTATKSGTDVAIAFDENVTFIFDCGNAEA